MGKRMVLVVAGGCLLLAGCASLLERSYSAVEPYTDRYWDTTAEDTLRAETYQDLVNSLLMLVEQRSEEGTIRYYAPDDIDSYLHALRARQEVRRDTTLGAYLLSGISVVCTRNETYCTLSYHFSYRENTQDIDTLMALTDSQSLTDLLRIAVREEHESITARFVAKTPREEVLNVVDGLWWSLYRDAQDEEKVLQTAIPVRDIPRVHTDIRLENGQLSAEGMMLPADEVSPEEGETARNVVCPPCPWEVHFYPDADYPEVVEIVLK